MPIINKQGEVTTVTVSPEAERQMIEFERKAIEQNMVIQQHGATMLEQNQPITKTTSSTPLEIYRAMKRIAGVQDISIPSTSSNVELHSASTTTAVSEKSKSVTNKQQDNTNLVLRNLMKKICSMASPTSL
jgi:hypothetical protein